MMIKLFLPDFFFLGGGGSKCVTKWQFLLILAENEPLLRLQMSTKEMFNRHQFVFL